MLLHAEAPLTCAQVREGLPDHAGLAYTTVMTTLHRLHEKGAVAREPAGRAFAYRLAVDGPSLHSRTAARRMRTLLAGPSDRREVLSHFVADLDPQDEATLRALLAPEPDQVVEPPTGRST